MEYLNSLKSLYSLNENQLNTLKTNLKMSLLPNNINYIHQCLGTLMKQQIQIKNRIPRDKYSIVNEFILELYTYIDDFKSSNNNSNNSNNNSNNSNNNSNNKINNLKDQSNYHLDTSILQKKPSFNYNQTSNISYQDNTSYQDNNQSNVDAYELYGIDKEKPINIEDVKKKYRKYALDTHPDKNNGDTKNFNIIKQAYKEISEHYLLKQKDKQYNELKNNSRSYIETQTKSNFQNKTFDKDNFNLNKFNNIYSKNKINDSNDEGYSNWCKENDFGSEDIQKDTRLNSGNFNNMFESNVKLNNDLVKYSKPKELNMNSENNCFELGVDTIDNFTGKSKSISYTDYKEAHTTSRLADPNSQYEIYNSINDLKAARSNIKELTSDEIMEIELDKSSMEEREQNRLENVIKTDNRYFDNYNKIHNIMLSRN